MADKTRPPEAESDTKTRVTEKAAKSRSVKESKNISHSSAKKTQKAEKNDAPAEDRHHKDRMSFYDQSRTLHRAMPYVMAVMAVACAVCIAAGTLSDELGGLLGRLLVSGLGSLFSVGAYTLPVILLLHGFYWRHDVRCRRLVPRLIFSFFAMIFVASLWQLISSPAYGGSYDAARFFFDGTRLVGGGFLGASLVWLLRGLLGRVCTYIVIIICLLLYIICYIDVKALYVKARAAKKNRTEKRKESTDIKLSLLTRIRLRRQARRSHDSYFSDSSHDEDYASVRKKFEEEERLEELKRRKERISQDPPRRKAAEGKRLVGRSGRMATDIEIEGMSVPGQSSMPDIPEAYTHGEPQARAFSRTPAPEKRAYDDTPAVAEAQASAAEPYTAESKTPSPAPAVPERIYPKASSVPAKQSAGLSESIQIDELPTPVRKVKQERSDTYLYPPLSLLINGKASAADDESEQEISKNSQILVETLKSFHVETHMVGTSRGPRITRYELMPEKGVKISSIIARTDDISLNLASAGIRIEAPIPGMAAVGIEVPNKKPSIVRIRDLFSSKEFAGAASKTNICLGSDVTGTPVFADVAKMPHLLIAGATGMGKSVCINAILLSLLFKARPDEVKLILVDPKKVELNVYNNIPHLLVPVVTEPQAAAGALIWAVGEMERRFELIEATGVRDITAYNRAVTASGKGEPLPKIIIVIDELNDLMMSARDAVEASICRIAQKARAAGMHLIIGTQRPSVDVITGLIKANIPSRIAFHVSSQVDSRTVLDTAGAEKLLDRGDMLAALVGREPRRVQGSMVEDEEVERVTAFLKENAKLNGVTYDGNVMEEINRETEKYRQSTVKRGDRDQDGDEREEFDEDIFNDPKFRQVAKLAIESGKISTSLVQRKLSIGYGRAAKYIDTLEAMGVVGGQDGSKPREVLMTWEQFMELETRS